MRTTLIFIFAFSWSLKLNAQDLDSLGINSSSTLNRQEVELLNLLLGEKRDTFNFQNKEVAFITGGTGNGILPKNVYFRSYVKPWLDKASKPQISIVQLTEEEKSKSNGYDVLVLSWVKMFTDKQRRRIVKRLSTRNDASEK